MAETIAVEVVVALPDQASRWQVRLPVGATVADAVRAAGLALPVDASPDRLGIFGRRVAPERRLVEGDRVEIYRPLRLDPKEARRRRARS